MHTLNKISVKNLIAIKCDNLKTLFKKAIYKKTGELEYRNRFTRNLQKFVLKNDANFKIDHIDYVEVIRFDLFKHLRVFSIKSSVIPPKHIESSEML